MEVFTLAFDPQARPPSLFPARSERLLLFFGLPALIGFILWHRESLPLPVLQIGGLVVLHGLLVAWALLHPLGWGWQWGRAVLGALGALLAGGTFSLLGPWWGWALLLLPLWIMLLAARIPPIRTLGLSLPRERWTLLLGAGAGSVLGVHLLVTASRTLGYRVALFPLSTVIADLSYDLAVNVVTAELLFRGAFFSRWWRRWGFWPAAILSTGLSVLRYLVDPQLPRHWEVAAGASFYLLLLGLAGCALVRMSGSVLPSGLATLCFFSAYRLLRP